MRIDDAQAPALWAAWLELGDDLLALTGGDGCIVWANPAFIAATGAVAGDVLAPWLVGSSGTERQLQAPGRAPLRVRVRSRAIDAGLLWVMRALEAGVHPDERHTRPRSESTDTDTEPDTEAHELARSLDATTMLLGLTVDLCDIVHWRHDLKTGLMHYNPNGYKALGLEVRAGGIPIDEVRTLLHPDDLPRVLASAQRALQSGLPDDVEARYWHRDGGWRNMQSRRIVQRAVDGTAIGFVGVSLDVTELLRRQRVNEDLMRRFESATVAGGLGIWSRDVASGEVSWNRQMYQITGRPPEQGPPPGLSWIEQIVCVEDRAAVRQELDQLRLEAGELARIEYRIVRPDGQTRWLENRFRLEQSDGRATVIGVTIDVTDRRRAEDALRNADERAALAARAAGIGTWEVDFDAQRRVATERWDAQMFHLRGLAPRDRAPTREERLAMIHPDDRQHTIDGFENSQAAKGPQSYEFRLLMPDGSLRWLASRSIVVRKDPRQPLRRVGINWDVTESKHTEIARQEKALAEQQSRAKSELLSRVSHELRTPLNAVR